MTTAVNGAGRPARSRKTTTAAKKAAPAAPSVTVEAALLPTAMNLDELEREGGPREPFAFIHAGRQFVLNDPLEQDWQRLIVVAGNPVLFLRTVLRDEDRDAFFDNAMPAWKLRALVDGYRAHFGMTDQGEAGGLSL